MKHILLQKVFNYFFTEPQRNKGYYYDEDKGYWVNKKSKIALMLENNGPKPDTKKCDVETGEDRKGE